MVASGGKTGNLRRPTHPVKEGAVTAYVVAIVNIKNPEPYQDYAKLAPAAVEKYGGKFLARGGINEVLEGGHLPQAAAA